jgi:hypothetical protein
MSKLSEIQAYINNHSAFVAQMEERKSLIDSVGHLLRGSKDRECLRIKSLSRGINEGYYFEINNDGGRNYTLLRDSLFCFYKQLILDYERDAGEPFTDAYREDGGPPGAAAPTERGRVDGGGGRPGTVAPTGGDGE